MTTTETRHRFHVRRVDRRRQVYVFICDVPKFFDACLTADTWLAENPGEDAVVWDSYEEKVLYDSRRW